MLVAGETIGHLADIRRPGLDVQNYAYAAELLRIQFGLISLYDPHALHAVDLAADGRNTDLDLLGYLPEGKATI